MTKRILGIGAMTVLATAGMGLGAAHADSSTDISGRIYANASSISEKIDGVKTSKDGIGFDVKRFYLGVDHKFDSIWHVAVTTDFTYSSATGLTDVYIKKAYGEANFSPALDVRIGSTDLPWVPFVEDIYGYRYVENVLADRMKFGTSADWGIHVKGKFGILSYAGAVVNGGGYKKLTRSKSVDFEGRISVEPIKGLTAAVGGYTGKLDADVTGVTTFHTATRLDALVAYKTKFFNIGGEYMHAKNWKQVLSAATDSADGFSVFGAVHPGMGFSVFARYDHTKPSKTLQPTLKNDYFNVGVEYTAAKTVNIALVYKNEQNKNGGWGTSNLSGGNAATLKDKYDEIGLFTQFKF
jgi:hypothetical protein